MARFDSLFASIKPAYAAALALIAIQVGIGILFKAAQSGGKYSFSPSSSVTISEFLKFSLSTFLFYRETLRRSYEPLPSERQEEDAEGGHITSSTTSLLEDKDSAVPKSEAEDARSSSGLERALLQHAGRFRPFLDACSKELSIDTRYGFAHLALFYVLINNTVFVLFRLADPGTIQLVKSGTTLITAVVSIIALGTTIGRRQWLAMILQVCGIVTTQYNPNSGSTYSVSTYLLLLFQTTVSSIASVYNQKLCKNSGSMHMMNMVLYASGSSINLVLHIIIRNINPTEPGFFTGYGSWGAVLVILSNVFIGIIMTAVYKYADAIIKCFAMAISTAILLYASPILFHTSFSFLVVPGTTVVFVAALFYMDFTPSPGSSSSSTSTQTPQKPSYLGEKILYFFSPQGPKRHIGLLMTSSFTLFIVTLLTYWNIHVDLPNQPADSGLATSTTTDNAIRFYSPFNKTLAFVRWNSYLPQRIEPIRAYSPYFHTVHISMPDVVNKNDTNATGIYYDTWKENDQVYQQVKTTMELIMDDPESSVEGLLFFQHDSWINPLDFTEMDFNKLWFPDSTNPRFRCMKNTGRYPDWGAWSKGYQNQALQSVRMAQAILPDYVIDPDEWCTGWSDIYYIPRRFFPDYMKLANTFYATLTFHELAIPTTIQIIDKTYQTHPTRSLVARLGDCWGDCCTENPMLEDVMWSRCGHRLNFQNQTVINGHFRRLKNESFMLGMHIEAGVSTDSLTTA